MKLRIADHKRRTGTTPSKDGLLFLLLTFIVGFAALNTGNNLLYIIFAIMISLVVVSGIMSMVNLRGLTVRVKNMPDFFALTPDSVLLTVMNRKPLPSFSLTLKTGNNHSYIHYLPGRDKEDVRLKMFFSSRGWNELPEITVNTRYPFGFFKKWIAVSADTERILVYPKIYDISKEQGTDNADTGNSSSDRTGHGEEFRSIREYTTGDNTKHIDWKKSAKSAKLMVKEFYSESSRVARVTFAPWQQARDNLEQYISKIASLVIMYTKSGYDIEFKAADTSISSRSNKEATLLILRYLALYQKNSEN